MSFRENSTDLVFHGLKVTSQFDAHVYICENQSLILLMIVLGVRLVSSVKLHMDDLMLRTVSFIYTEE